MSDEMVTAMRKAAKLLTDLFPPGTGFVLVALAVGEEEVDFSIRSNIEPDTVRNALRYALEMAEENEGTFERVDAPRPN